MTGMRTRDCSGFGGPIALVGYMHRDLVEDRGWYTEAAYQQGMAVAQMMPGPLAASWRRGHPDARLGRGHRHRLTIGGAHRRTEGRPRGTLVNIATDEHVLNRVIDFAGCGAPAWPPRSDPADPCPPVASRRRRVREGLVAASVRLGSPVVMSPAGALGVGVGKSDGEDRRERCGSDQFSSALSCAASARSGATEALPRAEMRGSPMALGERPQRTRCRCE